MSYNRSEPSISWLGGYIIVQVLRWSKSGSWNLLLMGVSWHQVCLLIITIAWAMIVEIPLARMLGGFNKVSSHPYCSWEVASICYVHMNWLLIFCLLLLFIRDMNQRLLRHGFGYWNWKFGCWFGSWIGSWTLPIDAVSLLTNPWHHCRCPYWSSQRKCF